MSENEIKKVESEIKKSATERLEDLEKMMAQVGQMLSSLDPMVRDITQMKEALKLLNNKMNAVTRAVNEGLLPTDDLVSGFMTETNAAELKGKVDQMVSSGILVASDTVSKESFVVLNEEDKDGKVVNPRMQFLLSALQHAEVKAKLDGAKVGDKIALGNEGASLNVLEAYNVAPPKAPEAPAAAPAAEASASEAPAAEASAPAVESSSESLPSSSEAPAAEVANA